MKAVLGVLAVGAVGVGLYFLIKKMSTKSLVNAPVQNQTGAGPLTGATGFLQGTSSVISGVNALAQTFGGHSDSASGGPAVGGNPASGSFPIAAQDFHFTDDNGSPLSLPPPDIGMNTTGSDLIDLDNPPTTQLQSAWAFN